MSQAVGKRKVSQSRKKTDAVAAAQVRPILMGGRGAKLRPTTKPKTKQRSPPREGPILDTPTRTPKRPVATPKKTIPAKKAKTATGIPSTNPAVRRLCDKERIEAADVQRLIGEFQSNGITIPGVGKGGGGGAQGPRKPPAPPFVPEKELGTVKRKDGFMVPVYVDKKGDCAMATYRRVDCDKVGAPKSKTSKATPPSTKDKGPEEKDKQEASLPASRARPWVRAGSNTREGMGTGDAVVTRTQGRPVYLLPYGSSMGVRLETSGQKVEAILKPTAQAYFHMMKNMVIPKQVLSVKFYKKLQSRYEEEKPLFPLKDPNVISPALRAKYKNAAEQLENIYQTMRYAVRISKGTTFYVVVGASKGPDGKILIYAKKIQYTNEREKYVNDYFDGFRLTAHQQYRKI